MTHLYYHVVFQTMDIHVLEEGWRAPLTSCQYLPEWGTCQKHKAVSTQRALLDKCRST